MDYKAIRNTIVKGLYEHLNIDVVPSNNNKKKPSYPYVTYKFIATGITKGKGNELRKSIPSSNANFEHDIEYTKQEQPQATISFTTYSLDDTEASQITENIKSWFKFEGRLFLKDNNIITVNTGSIQDRTILIVDNYEQRKGIDITIRYSTERKMIVETIETINVELNDKKKNLNINKY